jgi:hypothetical protein
MNASRFVFHRFISASYFARRNTGFASRSVVFWVRCAILRPAAAPTVQPLKNDSAANHSAKILSRRAPWK